VREKGQADELEKIAELKVIIGDEYTGLSVEEKLQIIAHAEAKEEKNQTDSEDEILRKITTETST